jgi:hypothetical protein
MTRHRSINELLPAFVLGELDELRASQVRSHAARCSQCREDLERLEKLLDCAARMGEQSVDRELCESAGQRVLLAASQEQTQRPRLGLESGGTAVWRIIMRSGATKFAVAAMIVVAGALGLYMFTGGGATSTYARVVDLLHNAHTLTFSILNQTGVESMPTVRTEIAFQEPGYMRTSTADGFVTILHKAERSAKGLNLIPLQKKYMTFEFTNVPDKPDSGPYVSIEKLRALPSQADEALGQKQIDGRILEGYRVHDIDTTTTVWVNPQTGEPARVEMEFPAAPGMNMVLSDFQFDVPLDDDLFSLEPPAGYEPMGVDLQANMDDVGEKDFVDLLRLWSNWTVDHTFPPTVSGTEIAKIAFQMAREGKFAGPVAPGYEDNQQQVMYDGMLFIGKLPTGTWRYAGQNVSFGDPQTPIFWYQPQGASQYRVIYADLSVRAVAPEMLPK